jgi:hypothetical protein
VNVQRILYAAIAWVAVAAAAVVCVVAASFGVFAAARTWVGPAWAAAVVVGVFALLALGLAAFASRKAAPPRPKPGAVDDASLTDRLIDLAREKPVIALGAAAAASAAAVAVLVRNPALVTALVSAFMAGSASKPKP